VDVDVVVMDAMVEVVEFVEPVEMGIGWRRGGVVW
jgi:hypothetical protein